MKEKKTIQKSIRMTQRVNDYVNTFSGDGFNEKFENLVLFCMEHEQDIKSNINTTTQRLQALNKQIQNKHEILSKLQRIETQVNYLLNYTGGTE